MIKKDYQSTSRISLFLLLQPLDKHELERLCQEVAKVKKELDREMAQCFLSPSSEGDSHIPPMSPILKSPSVEFVAVSSLFSLHLHSVKFQICVIVCLHGWLTIHHG